MQKHTFGHALRVAAVDAGLTQAQLAELVGLGRETVSAHMRGVTEPTLSQMGRYAQALHYTFTVAPPAEAPAPGVEPGTYRLTMTAAAA